MAAASDRALRIDLPVPSRKSGSKRRTTVSKRGGRRSKGRPQATFQKRGALMYRSEAVPVARAVTTGRRTASSRTITNSELVGVLVANSTINFQLLGASGLVPGYDCNPGNALLFPWLSPQALLYERYKFQSLRFRMVSGNPTTIGGRIVMGFDYDYADNPPSDYQTAAATSGAISGNAFASLTLNVSAARLNQDFKSRYTSHTGVPATGSEPRTSYAGFFFAGAQGCASGGSWELWVDYTVELMIPQMITSQLTASGVTQVISMVSPQSYGYLPASIVGATIPLAVPGSTAPAMNIPGFVSATAPVLDIGGLLAGTITQKVRMTATVDTPTVVCNTLYSDMGVFDSAGAFLGLLSTASGKATNGYTFGPDTSGSSSWAVANQALVSFAVASLSALKLALPLARYLAPYWGSTVAKAGVTGVAANTDWLLGL